MNLLMECSHMIKSPRWATAAVSVPAFLLTFTVSEQFVRSLPHALRVRAAHDVLCM
jgi:hypothetical protein